VLDQIRETSLALVELADSLRPDEPREALLARVAARVVTLMPGADGVTVTLFVGGHPDTVAATERSLIRLDEVQYAAENGPCLESLNTETVVRASPAEMSERWPEFGKVARQVGIGTSLSCPLFLPLDGAVPTQRAVGRRLSGALNVWSFRQGAFAPVESALIAMFTSAMSSIILTAARWAEARKQANELLDALENRDAIATAKGIVMVRHDLDADDAFKWLVNASHG
jgi:hypothetical protein